MAADKGIARDGLEVAARMVGDRWTLSLVGTLLEGERTFGELAGAVAGIAPTILTARLRNLQRLGLLTATPYAHRPVRMRYALTAPGRRLAAALAVLAEWGAEREGIAGAAVHSRCGTPLVSRPWCPTCDEPAGPGEEAGGRVWC